MPSTAGKGFGSSSKDTSSYQTIFEKVKDQAAGEQRSLSWYKNTIHKLSGDYTTDNPIVAEKRDSYDDSEEQDGNILRTTVRQGHLYLFEYKAQSKYLPYWDKFPLVYCIKSDQKEFFGANLHYMTPKKRILAVRDLMKGRINLPKACFHKYLKSNIDGLLLDLSSEEWDTAILLPVEDFVITRKDSEFNFRKEEVWSETNENFYDRIKARRVVRGYGTQESVAMAR